MQVFEQICHYYRLGTMTAPPEVVPGGTMHRTWRVSTETGEFALKRLNKSNHTLLGKQHLSTDQAQHLIDKLLKVGIATHSTIHRKNNVEYDCDGATWAVYRWVEGECLDQSRLSPCHAYKMGELLAKLHQSGVDLRGLEIPKWGGLLATEWTEYSEHATEQKLQWADYICQSLDSLSYWSDQARIANQSLLGQFTVSHRDLNILNVIWTPDGEPVLIDWELGGLIHPHVEVFLTAMNWSYRNDELIEVAFIAVFDGYQFPDSVDVKQIYFAYAGYLLDWLIFNMRRSLVDPQQVEVSHHEICYVLEVLNFLENKGIEYFRGLLNDRSGS